MEEYRVQARLTSRDDQIQNGIPRSAHDLPKGWAPFLFDRISQKSDPKNKPAREGTEPDHENVTWHTAADNNVRDNQQGGAKSKDTAQEKQHHRPTLVTENKYQGPDQGK
jgi:hypothetical protein